MTSTLPRVPDLPVLDDDPFGPEVLADPTGFHERMRAAGPAVYLPAHDVVGLARYREVYESLVNWQGFGSGAGVGLSNFRTEPPWRPPSLLLETDPPAHDAPRRVLAPILGPRALRRLRERWAAEAEALLDDLLGRVVAGQEAEFDAVPELAEAFPLRVFPDAVGISREGRENLLPYGDHLFNAFGPANDLVAKGAHRIARLSAWVDEQCAREALDDDGFGAQVWAAADRGEITPEQAPVVVRSLLSAGVDTTVTGLAALLHALALHPRAWARLRERPELVRRGFDEAVRWESPVQTFFRTAAGEVELAGVRIPDNQKVLMFLGSANRDPRRWGADAGSFDLDRDPSGHVGFGMGLHQCVGQHVARLEAESLLGALAARVQTIELAGPAVRRPNNTMRAWSSIPVRVRLGSSLG